MTNMIKIAGRVLEEISLLDTRIRVTEDVILAWARVFEGQEVFFEEAMRAVHGHYRKPNAFSIQPGDVIGYCTSCPPWSSAEHASAFLDLWAQYPYSVVIEDYTGVRIPRRDVPDEVPPHQHREWLVERTTEWVNENRAELIAALLERRHKPVTE